MIISVNVSIYTVFLCVCMCVTVCTVCVCRGVCACVRVYGVVLHVLNVRNVRLNIYSGHSVYKWSDYNKILNTNVHYTKSFMWSILHMDPDSKGCPGISKVSQIERHNNTITRVDCLCCHLRHVQLTCQKNRDDKKLTHFRITMTSNHLTRHYVIFHIILRNIPPYGYDWRAMSLYASVQYLDHNAYNLICTII